jgi:hypothetical protein
MNLKDQPAYIIKMRSSASLTDTSMLLFSKTSLSLIASICRLTSNLSTLRTRPTSQLRDQLLEPRPLV